MISPVSPSPKGFVFSARWLQPRGCSSTRVPHIGPVPVTSDLRARLARLGYAPGAAPAPIPAPTKPRFPAIEEVVGGQRVSTPHGECVVVERVHPAGHPHGSLRLDEALEVDRSVLPWLGRSAKMADLDLTRTVFLDTETTGLSGGTGTYTFLVGLGYFEGSSFVSRQLFMDEYGEEEALLHTLAEDLTRFTAVVTFNGRAFDLPLLETRFLMGRRPFPLRDALHMDLLFSARRLWKERLQSCALSNLEERILGVEREGDTPGWMIPSLYFNYLRSRDPGILVSVFEHNRLDLLSMATLLARLAAQHADPFRADWEDPLDLFSLGGLFETLAEHERAIRCYERAVELADSREGRARVMMRLGSLYKRLRQRQDAAAIWKALASGGHAYSSFAYVELAKHYEHVSRDYLEAERVTLQALSALELRAARGYGWQTETERRDLEHRLARLRRKAKGSRP